MIAFPGNVKCYQMIALFENFFQMTLQKSQFKFLIVDHLKGAIFAVLIMPLIPPASGVSIPFSNAHLNIY